jgi:hypothetical protein
LNELVSRTTSHIYKGKIYIEDATVLYDNSGNKNAINKTWTNDGACRVEIHRNNKNIFSSLIPIKGLDYFFVLINNDIYLLTYDCGIKLFRLIDNEVVISFQISEDISDLYSIKLFDNGFFFISNNKIYIIQKQ